MTALAGPLIKYVSSKQSSADPGERRVVSLYTYTIWEPSSTAAILYYASAIIGVQLVNVQAYHWQAVVKSHY